MDVYVFEIVTFINETNAVRIDGKNEMISGIDLFHYKDVKKVEKDDENGMWKITLSNDHVNLYTQANYKISVVGG